VALVVGVVILLLTMFALSARGADEVTIPVPLVSADNTITYEGELYTFSHANIYLAPRENGYSVYAINRSYYFTEDINAGIMRVTVGESGQTMGWAINNTRHHGGIIDTDCDGIFETGVLPSADIIVYECYIPSTMLEGGTDNP
jgi:hypothetical protein